MIRRIAIVDDDDIFQFTTKIKLQKNKLAEEVLFFHDGGEMLEYIEESSIDDLPEIILLDINMPIVDGWDFINLFQKLDKSKQNKMQIYMLSSSINPDDVRRAEESSYINDYITKPIRDKDLKIIFKNV